MSCATWRRRPETKPSPQAGIAVRPVRTGPGDAPGSDLTEASAMIIRLAEDFPPGEMTEEGFARYRTEAAPGALLAKVRQGNPAFVAIAGDDRIVAFAAARDRTHLSLLFVDPAFQGRGLARRLVEVVMQELRHRFPEAEAMTLNARPAVIPVYERMGFTATGPIETKGGITFQPMRIGLRNV